MNAPYFFRFINILWLLVMIGFNSCERDIDVLEPATYPTNGDVFIDGISGGLDYQAFLNTKLDAITIDTDDKYAGESSLRITVPNEGDPSGFFSGGAFVSPGGRDLSGYDALTFWAKASMVAPLGLVGFGNDNSGNSLYPAFRSDITLTTAWQKFVVPIPDANKLVAEKGLFQYAAGAFEKAGFEVWFDEVQFEKLGTVAQPRAVITSDVVSGEVGEVFSAGVTGVIYNVNGVDVTVNAAPAYFTLSSSDESVATINDDGAITGVGVGTAEITVRLGSVEVGDKITVNVAPAAPRPPVPAPTPTVSADSVISMFSNAYSNVPVDTWDTNWEFSTAELQDIQIAGDDVKKYTELNFVGIEFASQTIDATDMTHFHLDIWTPDPTAPPAVFRVLLVDFGPNGVFDGGGDDSQHELTFTSPLLQTESWVSLDIPLSNFTGLIRRGNLAQLVLSGDLKTVYVDNVYFYKGEVAASPEPTEPAPTPTASTSDVRSVFSDAYTNIDGTNLNPDWGQSTVVTQVDIQGNNTLKYAGLNYQGIELGSNQDLSGAGMDFLHIDVWTANSTALSVFLISPGDPAVETPYALTVPTSGWSSVDIPLSAFAPVDLADVFQLKFEGNGDIWLDNIYFYNSGGGGGSEPTEPAPTPTMPEADVISLFSNAYSNVTVDTWSAIWDNADVADVQIAGNDAKLYTNLVFAGIEFTSQTVDAAMMTHFHMDIWTPDPTAAPAVFKIKLVDFGPNGVFDGGPDDAEHELTFDATTNPPLVTGQWISFDIPFTDFINLVTRGHLAQLIIVGDPGPNTVYVDNVLFHK